MMYDNYKKLNLTKDEEVDLYTEILVKLAQDKPIDEIIDELNNEYLRDSKGSDK